MSQQAAEDRIGRLAAWSIAGGIIAVAGVLGACVLIQVGLL